MLAASINPGMRAAESAARDSYGRLLAYLARAWRDVALAEDALGEAFAKALETWPRTGVPENPEAWLLVAARNRLKDLARSGKVRTDSAPSLLLLSETEYEAPPMIADKRLELLFVCAHPAIDAAARTPLMLQTVLGLTAQRVASSFLVAPDTMARRLSRAKQRIRDTGIAFEVPAEDELAERTEFVLEAIYAAYGQGWDGAGADDIGQKGLAEEAIWLARVLVALRPDEAEALGLLALMLFCQSRAVARRLGERYVPLAEQEIGLWDLAMAREAEALLHRASRLQQPGRFQLEAAIQSAIIQSRLTGADMRHPIWTLHVLLAHHAPTISNLVGLAAAAAEARGAQAGLDELSRLPEEMTRNYQPFWALRADLLRRLGDQMEAARQAYERAIGLSTDNGVRLYLLQKRDALMPKA